jgi:hypothetical protein
MSRLLLLITLFITLACGGLAPQIGSVGPPWNTMNLPTTGTEVVLSTRISLTLKYPNQALLDVHNQWVEEAKTQGWKKVFSDIKPDTATTLYSDGVNNYMIVVVSQPDGAMVTLGLDEGGSSGVDPAAIKRIADVTEAVEKPAVELSPADKVEEEDTDEAAAQGDDTDTDADAAPAAAQVTSKASSSWGSTWVANMSSGDCKGITEKNASWCDSADCKGIADGNASWCSTQDCKGVADKNASWCSSALCKAWADGNASWCDNGDCRGIVEKNPSWCNSPACKAIADGNSSWCP